MRSICKPLACCALCVLLGAVHGSSAQTVGATKKRIPADPAAQALNGLLAAAQEAVDRKDYATAAQNYQDFLAKKPDDATVHYDLGYVYTAMERPADAKSEYEKAISLDPKMAPAYMNLGLTLLATDSSAAIQPLEKASELSPQDARAKWLLGTALERNGKLPEAIDQYEAAEKLDGKDFDTRLSLGRALLSANRPSDAEPEFRAAMQLNQDASAAHLGLAHSLLAQKKLEGSASEFAAYLQTVPNDTAVRMERATVLVDLGKDEDALAELDRAAAGRPEDLRSLNLRSRIYWEKKQYDDAVPVLQKAAAIAPTDADIPARLGEVYYQKKDFPNAAHWLGIAYKMNPDATDLLADIIAAEYATKNYAPALEALDTLSKHEELPLSSWYVRASCYDNLGQAAQALDAYKKFLELNKDENSDMYFASTARVRTLTRELQNKKR
jgi:superkiller protein 3